MTSVFVDCIGRARLASWPTKMRQPKVAATNSADCFPADTQRDPSVVVCICACSCGKVSIHIIFHFVVGVARGLVVK